MDNATIGSYRPDLPNITVIVLTFDLCGDKTYSHALVFKHPSLSCLQFFKVTFLITTNIIYF